MTDTIVSVPKLLAEADAAAKRRDWAAAAGILGDAGESTAVLDKRAFFLSRDKQYDEALGLLAVLHRREPKQARWAYMAGYQYYEQEKYRDALPWFEKAADLEPDHIRNLYRLAQTYRKLSLIVPAQRTGGRILRLWSELPADQRDRERHTVAKTFYVMGKLQDSSAAAAAPMFEQAAALDPADPDKQYQLGKAKRRLGKHVEAIAALQKAHRLNPRADYIAVELAAGFAVSNEDDRVTALLEQWQGRAHGWTALKAAGIAMKVGKPNLANRFLRDGGRDPQVRGSDMYHKLKQGLGGELDRSGTPSTAATQTQPTGEVGDRHVGRVHHVKPDKRFGFLDDDTDGARRYFKVPSTTRLARGDRVTFIPREGRKGPAAEDVESAV